MRIIKSPSGGIYLDQDLKNELNKIWATYKTTIPNDKNIFFLKNTTVPRLVTDYLGKNISRVIKKEKADYCIIDKIEINDYVLYWNEQYQTITKNDTDEPVYGTGGLGAEDLFTIEQIVDFHNRGQKVIYVDQYVLNDSLNNGFVINKENYTTLLELINSNNTDNLSIAANMLINSDLNQNWQWICYMYFKKTARLIDKDPKSMISMYFRSKNLDFRSLTNSFDQLIEVVTDPDVKDCLTAYIRKQFTTQINEYLQNKVGTSKFILNDFQLDLK